MAEVPPTSPPTTIAGRAWSAASGIWRAVSLSHLQNVVAILAGGVTVFGAAFSMAPAAKPADTGQLVTIVRAAGSQRTVTDATVEIFTAENTLVATLTADATGRAARQLREGVYVVRISHPRYAADVHRVEVQPRQTVEVKAALRAGASPPGDHSVNVDRTMNKGLSAIKRALGF